MEFGFIQGSELQENNKNGNVSYEILVSLEVHGSFVQEYHLRRRKDACRKLWVGLEFEQK